METSVTRGRPSEYNLHCGSDFREIATEWQNLKYQFEIMYAWVIEGSICILWPYLSMTSIFMDWNIQYAAEKVLTFLPRWICCWL